MTNFYVNVAMGLGGNIALSSVITEIKNDFGDEYNFNVMSPYWDTFMCNKNVAHVYKPEEAHDFIYDCCDDKNGKLVLHRLYDLDSFVKKEASYKSAWYELFGIKPKNKANNLVSMLDTSMFGLQPQVDNVLKAIKEKGYEDFIIVNFEGSVSPLQQVPQDKDGKPDWSKVPDPYTNEPLARLYPRELASAFIRGFMAEHPKTAVINYTLPNQANYNVGEFKFIIPYLAYYDLAKLPECKGFVGIDSSGQHLFAGQVKGVVIWAHSINADKNGKIIVNNFGYDSYTNVIQSCRRDDVKFFSMLGPSHAKVDYIKPDQLLKIVDARLFGNEEPKTYYNKNGEYIAW